MNLTTPLDVHGPVNFESVGDIERPVVVGGLVNFENSVFTLRLVEVREPVVVRGPMVVENSAFALH